MTVQPAELACRSVQKGPEDHAAEKRSDDPAEASASLAGLYLRLEKTVPAVDWLVPAHSGGVEGLDALRAFSDTHSP